MQHLIQISRVWHFSETLLYKFQSFRLINIEKEMLSSIILTLLVLGALCGQGVPITDGGSLRETPTPNLISNYNFGLPSLQGIPIKFFYKDQFSPWTGPCVGIESGPFHNPAWVIGSQVVDTKPDKIRTVTGMFMAPATGLYTISWEWAARTGSIATSTANFQINNVVLAQFDYTDEQVYRETFSLSLNEGPVKIDLVGTGVEGISGVGVTNILLYITPAADPAAGK